jgi:hypothetical protein
MGSMMALLMADHGHTIYYFDPSMLVRLRLHIK